MLGVLESIVSVDDERKIVAGLPSGATGADGASVPQEERRSLPQTIQRAFDQSQSIPIPFFYARA